MQVNRRSIMLGALASLGIGLYNPLSPSLSAQAAALEGIILDDYHMLVGRVDDTRTIFDLVSVDDDGKHRVVANSLFTIVETDHEFKIEHTVAPGAGSANLLDSLGSFTFWSKDAAIHTVTAAGHEFIFM